MDDALSAKEPRPCAFLYFTMNNNNKKNDLWRGDSVTVGLLLVGVICIVLAAGAAFVWPGLVAEDTAAFDLAAGVVLVLLGVVLAFRK